MKKQIEDLLEVHEAKLFELLTEQQTLKQKHVFLTEAGFGYEAAYIEIKIRTMRKPIEHYNELIEELKKIIE